MKDNKTKKPKAYVTKKELMDELIKYNETGIISEEIGTMFLKIARKFCNHSNWAGYPQHVKDDFIGEAVLRMVSQIGKFDVNHPKANPFAYFTQVVYHKFIMEVKKHYKQINIQRKMCEHYIEEIECNQHMDPDSFLTNVLKERVDELN